ncbi:unnamed protein product [Rhizophagus irregularis]|nr:unnamed protein product [Rhizophagus irregularis]
MAGYGIPLGISPGVTDDWKKFSRLVCTACFACEGSGDDKKVNIKADENTRKYLAQYEASRPGTVMIQS